MAASDRMVKFITQLNRLTQEGEILWATRDAPPSLVTGTNEVIPVFFATSYRGRNLGIHEVRDLSYDPEFDRTAWRTEIVLGFFSEQWTLLSRYQDQSSGLWALLESVQQQVAGVDEFIDMILPEEEEEQERS